MCGIAGWLDLEQATPDADLAAAAEAMAARLGHRGPDDRGLWVDAAAGIALAHRRLAVIDLSAEGHQPMSSHDARLVLAYNGEIYNFRELRADLEREGAAFRGQSDTEVALEAIAHWGLRRALAELNGMFALALWDRRERRLTLVRDRLGEKPLYYVRSGSTLLFASELKALRAHPRFSAEVDREALALYLRAGYVPAPRSIYRGVRKLAPGTLLEVEAGSAGAAPAEPVAYWSARAAAEQGAARPLDVPEPEALAMLEALLADAVRMRLAADVPLGAFLSGGIDSSMIVALMQAHGARPVKTFTVGFADREHDEAASARAVARHLGTDHTEIRLEPGDALRVIDRLGSLYDEPFADPSQIPTFLVAELARRQVTVALSGDGGDELFWGYNRHVWAAPLWRRSRALPGPVLSLLSRLLRSLPPPAWDACLRRLGALLPGAARQRSPGAKLHRLADLLAAPDVDAAYLGLASHVADPAAVLLGVREPSTALTDPSAWPSLADPAARMAYLDLVTYLPDDILVKLDRATMAVSLEARVPFLDHRVVELALRLPPEMKVRGGRGKWILRKLLERYLPRPLFERPKAGFGVPIGRWLAGPLRDWARDRLDPARLAREGFLDAQVVSVRLEQHLAGHADWQLFLWDVLVFETWLEASCEGVVAGVG